MLSSGENMVPYLPRPSSVVDRRWKPNVELAPNCPRCDSSNTKFCYYNNYSLTQPRYFCKGCRRYWTKGGSLRNVPVGGGCRKNRRGRPLRPSGAADSASSRESPNSVRCQLPGSVRPDLMLDDQVGNSSGLSGGSGSVSSADTSRSDGSDIDLAVLYSKFLNQQCPEFDPGLVVPAELPVELDEPIEFSAGTLNQSYNNTIQLQQALANIPDCQIPPTIGETQFGTSLHASVEEFINLTPSNCGSQLLLDEASVAGDLFWSNCPMVTSSMWQPLQNNGFVPLLEDPTILNQNLLNTNWNMFESSAYDQSLSRP